MIKPSGVPYAELTPKHMVAGLARDRRGARRRRFGPRPTRRRTSSSIAPSARRRHRPHAFGSTRRRFAQARAPIRCMGTTHADYFRGDVPVTRPLREAEVASDYERNTGLVIVETFRSADLSPEDVPRGARREPRSVRLGRAIRSRRWSTPSARAARADRDRAPGASRRTPRARTRVSSRSTTSASTAPRRTTDRSR